MFSICLCSRFQYCPKEIYLKAVKRIIKYLKGTLNLGLWCAKGNVCEMIGFCDTDFAGCHIDRKATSDTCHFLRNYLVSWPSKKEACVALSTADAEYIAFGSFC